MKKSAIFIASATIAIFITGCIIITHNLFSNFKQLLATLTGHHWTSVSVVIIVLFVLFSGLLSSSEKVKGFLRVYDVKLWSHALLAVTLLMILGIFTELVSRYLAD